MVYLRTLMRDALHLQNKLWQQWRLVFASGWIGLNGASLGFAIGLILRTLVRFADAMVKASRMFMVFESPETIPFPVKIFC